MIVSRKFITKHTLISNPLLGGVLLYVKFCLKILITFISAGKTRGEKPEAVNYKGFPKIPELKNLTNCLDCKLCQEICPAECIFVQKSNNKTKIVLEALDCCLCGFCEEVCVDELIQLNNYDLKYHFKRKNFRLKLAET